ncbi:MAG: putative metallopeptidase [Myxococcaceae bacterium]
MARRPDFNQAVRNLLEHVAKAMPEFAHLQPKRVMVVAGEARRSSHATVKPLAFEGGKRTDDWGRKKPLVKLNGKRMLYCITLRPLFFRNSSPHQRVATVLHELFHISKAFDGTLDERRRHSKMGKRFKTAFEPLLKRYLKLIPDEVLAPLAYDGEVRVSYWLERPSAWLPKGKRYRGVYTEAQLFEGIVRMRSRTGKILH